jgi:beta-phosphoglucomutase-like phosphatase (HAD superfamily)
MMAKNIFSNLNIDTSKTIGLIFDIDELVYDNRHEIFLAYRSLLDSRNISMHDDESFPGANLFDIVSGIKEKYSLEGTIEDLISERRKRYIKLLSDGDPRVKPGIKEVFSFLERNKDDVDLRLAYASSSERAFVEIILKKVFKFCGLGSYVEDPDEFFYKDKSGVLASTCWGPGLKKKPDPVLYDETVKKLGLSRRQCIAFEDSRSGLAAALAANLNVVVVPSANNEKYFKELKFNVIYEKRYCKIKSMLVFLDELMSLKNNTAKRGKINA